MAADRTLRLRLPALVGAAAAVLIAGVAAGAAGQALILGAANNSGTSQTILTNSGLGAAFTLKTTNTAGGATGIFGWSSNAGAGATRGVYGRVDGPNSYGVFALQNGPAGTGAALGAAGGLNTAISAVSASQTTLSVANAANLAAPVAGSFTVADTSGKAVVGHATADTGNAVGIYGQTDASFGYGVYGYASSTANTTYAVYGESDSPTGYGVTGEAYSATGFTHGVLGIVQSPDGIGVWADNDAETGLALDLMLGGSSSTAAGDNGNMACDLSYTGCDVFVYANDEVQVQLDNDNNEAGDFTVYNGTDAKIFGVDEFGNVTAAGTYTSPSADFAELMAGVPGLRPGDVLVIGADGLVARSAAAGDRAVVGVYSTRPAFLGGYRKYGETGLVPVAIVGIVPVRVSAENGAIRPGDLLISSATTGHAMRAGSTVVPGTVIGKALGSLDAGTGTITLLVMPG